MLVLALLACADEAQLNEPDGATFVEEPTPEPLVPEAGDWSIEHYEIVRDECGGILGDGDSEGELFALEVHEEGEFTITFTFDDGESYSVDCWPDEQVLDAFVCDGFMDLYVVQDTTLSIAWSGGGELHSEQALSAELHATALCEGSLCDTAEAWLETTLPCEGAMAMEAVRSP